MKAAILINYKNRDNMEPIIIPNSSIEEVELTIMDSGCVKLEQLDKGVGNTIYLDKSAAITLARSIIEHCSEWVPTSDKPKKSGYYHTKHADGEVSIIYYSHVQEDWYYFTEDGAMVYASPTHYRPIF